MVSSPIEIAKIEMFRRKVEFDGLQAVGEAFEEILLALLKIEFLLGQLKFQLYQNLVIEEKKKNYFIFLIFRGKFKEKKYVAGNKFSIADIDAYTALTLLNG